ncbi:diacylglycerol acyltransferase, partial [Ostertagia ostertagi]
MFIRPIRFLGIDWEPLIVPSKSRLETLAVVHFMFLWIILPIISTWNWYKNHAIWTHFADYFPLKIVKTADLPPDRNYIIGLHPHGVLSIGAFTAMVTSGTGFPDMFPGLKSTILTLNGQFWFPFPKGYWQLVLVELKRHESRSNTCCKILVKVEQSPSSWEERQRHWTPILEHTISICLLVEDFVVMPLNMDLVPMYHFGENDVFDRWEGYTRGTRLREIQTWIKNKFGFCPPLVKGRGIFNYSLGMLPHRRPITTVIGAPI